MCRDGCRATCAEDGCDVVLTCRDYTKCEDHDPGQWAW